jgi:hypothetical protein
MAERVSVVIPARDEIYLQKTIESVLSAAKGDVEVIAICDGYWPDPPVADEPRVKLIHNTVALGQRGSINQAARIATGKYILKTDAHSMFDEGFDLKLQEDCEPDWTVIPRMYNLDEATWTPKMRYKTDFMFIRSPYVKDKPFRVQYFDGPTSREFPEAYRAHRKARYTKGDICDVMTGQGACWFMHLDRFWELGGLDEEHGHWGQMGAEIACKSWLSGGRQVVNKKTWFSHLFRGGAGGAGFPWPASGRQQDAARKYSIDLWSHNKWEGQKRPLSWLVEKFAPVPSWSDLTVLYYTANVVPDKMQEEVTKGLKKSVNGNRIISISHQPMKFGDNLKADVEGRSVQNIYKQVLQGAKEADTKYVALTEDDCFYTPEHFKHRPKESGFAYNLNRWLLHTKDELYTYRKRPVLSQCIADRETLIKNLEERFALPDVPKKYCGEMGCFEKKLGMEEYSYETFETEKPNLVICHNKGVMGVKYHGKDAEPKTELEGWGTAAEVLNRVTKEDNVKFGRGAKPGFEKVPRRQHSYIGSVEFTLAEIVDNRRYFCDPRKKSGLEKFLKCFPPFMERVHAGEVFDDEKLQTLNYYHYMIAKLNPTDRDPLTSKGKRHTLNLLKDAIRLYYDIKHHGLKAPLDMWREPDGKLTLHRGGRRLEILKVLKWNKIVPVRLFRSKELFVKYNPFKGWTTGTPSGTSIHALGVKQFTELGHKATDKYWVHGYTSLYDKHIGHLRDKKMNILEIGVFRGASLLLWKEAFPNSQIYGVDKNWRMSREMLEGQDRITVHQGRQEDVEFLKSKVVPSGPFDIIIDDGGHKAYEQQPSFDVLWGNLKPGGFYVIEDLFGNYRKDVLRKGKERGFESTIEVMKRMIDEIHLKGEIRSLTTYYNICFIEKI